MAVLHLQRALSDRDGRLDLLLAGEREVVNGVQLRRFPRLKRERQAREEQRNRPGPQAIANSFDRLAGEAPGDVFDVTLADICTPGYSRTVRAVPKYLRDQAFPA